MITMSGVKVFINEYEYTPGKGQNTIFYIGEEPWYGWKGESYIIRQWGNDYLLYYVEDKKNLSLTFIDKFDDYDSAYAYAELTYV